MNSNQSARKNRRKKTDETVFSTQINLNQETDSGHQELAEAVGQVLENGLTHLSVPDTLPLLSQALRKCDASDSLNHTSIQAVMTEIHQLADRMLLLSTYAERDHHAAAMKLTKINVLAQAMLDRLNTQSF